MKILITTDWYAPVINGVVTSVINLQKELEKLGHEVKVLTLSDKKHSYRKDKVTYISSVGVGKIYPSARVALPLDNKYIDELICWHPDVIHSQCEFSTFHMACQIAEKANVPIVHTYHTVYEDYTHYFSPNKKFGRKVVMIFTRKILERTECVIVPTEKVQSLLVGYGIDKEIHILPTGIDLERFNFKIRNTERERLLKKIGVPCNNKILISIGRLAKEKRLEEIIIFLSHLNNRNITLLIVGDGPYREELEQYVSRVGVSDNVIFTGMVPPEEVALYYQLGDVFVSASNSETQGLTYIEALASGVPALCRRDPCLNNVIKDGVNGWQYESFEDFCEKLNYMLDERQHKVLSENARIGTIYNYSSSTFAKKAEEVYINAIKHYQKINVLDIV